MAGSPWRDWPYGSRAATKRLSLERTSAWFVDADAKATSRITKKRRNMP
jgi:hypothetical protein